MPPRAIAAPAIAARTPATNSRTTGVSSRYSSATTRSEPPSSFSKRSGSSNGPISARRSAFGPEHLLRDPLDVLGRDRVDRGHDLFRLDGAALEHLAAQPEEDQPLRVFELEDEAALREVLRLVELVRRHRLVDDPLQLLDDRRHGLVDPLDVDACLRVQRAGVGVAVVDAVDVVREAAPLAHLREQARRHPAAEHGRQHLEDVPVGVVQAAGSARRRRCAPDPTAS